MEPTGDARQGTGGSGFLYNQENRRRWKQTQALRQKRLPPLLVDDYKVVIRPRDGLNFTIIAMAQLSAAKMNRVVVSTPNMESSTRVQQISALTLATKQYEVTAYLAVPDNACRGVISGVETRPTAEELTENLRATGINILYARMMGQTNTAVITFEGIKVPRFVYLMGGGGEEYPCRPYQPRQQVCGVCLGLGHRTDGSSQPEQSRCTTCGAPGGAVEDHECTAHCVNCGGEHPATDHRCTARQRAPYNKEHVARYLREKEQQRTPPSPPPPLPYNALASHHWPEPRSYNRVNPDSNIPTNVEEKEYDRSSSGPPQGQPSHTKRNATPERNGHRRNPSDNANKAKTQSLTRSRSQRRQREQQRRPDQQNQPEINTPEPGHKGANVEALDTTLRTSFRTAVGLPQHVFTEHLLQLGLHDTVEELMEAQQIGQMTRLGRTTTGRALLRRFGYRVPTTLLEEGRQKPAPPTIAAKLRVMPIPKNMHSQAHAGRRLARVRYLRKRYHHDPDALYTDTRSYTSPSGCRCVAVCDSDGCNGTVASLRGSPTCAEAEETAIALAISTTHDNQNFDPDTTTVTILTDSQAACRAWAGGLLSPWSKQILFPLDHNKVPLVRIVYPRPWFPSRERGGRRLSPRRDSLGIASGGRHDRPLDDHARDSTRNPPNPTIDTYTQVTEYYRMSRRTYPPPLKSLTRQDATDWRKLQTLSFPYLLHLHRFFPNRYRCECPGCISPEPTLYHCTWACPTPVGAALLASQPDLQLMLLDRAWRVAQACGALD
ncbi:hypothetical protein HPB47_020789 [Ixodes persulcatus]|uniref:Uncharacterized protein n=1 Tax=Ixodes persulcatus TaxID=34615 RepID=A0AC60QF67_IXOPE|nr:hypothetical protein HPB47_020789 [Ixodes persulcatus]